MKKNEIKDMVLELFDEAANGKFVISSEEEYEWRYYSRFYTCIEGKDNTKNGNYPTAQIPNLNEFVDALEKYLEQAELFYDHDREYHDLYENKDFDKFLTLCLFASAGNGDFQDITKFVCTRMEMIQHQEDNHLIDMGEIIGYPVQVKITKAQASFEAPYKFTPHVYDENVGEEFVLPSVAYGIVKDKAIIYAVQGKNGKQSNKVSKDVDRYLRKINKGVDSDDVIANVSPNALASLTMFMSYMRERGVKNIEARHFYQLDIWLSAVRLI